MTDTNIKADEAQDALDSVEQMKASGFRRAAPPRWFAVGMSLIVTVGFALYGLNEPGDVPALFIVLGLALFVGFSRQRISAVGREELPDTTSGILGLVGVSAFLIALFFGGIIIRRTYDLAWVPLLTGIVAGMTIYLLSESERRYLLSKSNSGVDG